MCWRNERHATQHVLSAMALSPARDHLMKNAKGPKNSHAGKGGGAA